MMNFVTSRSSPYTMKELTMPTIENVIREICGSSGKNCWW